MCEKYKKNSCVVYVRSASDSNWYGLMEQAYEACKFANDTSLYISDVFIDHGTKGNTMNRPALQKMLSRIANNPVEYVVVRDISRLSREIVDYMKLCNKFSNLGVTLITLR